jgi:GAF domain-containing protein
MDLDANQVTKWLDAHPDFLNEYMRKYQAKQRCGSILNDYLSLSGGVPDSPTVVVMDASSTAPTATTGSAMPARPISPLTTTSTAPHSSSLFLSLLSTSVGSNSSGGTGGLSSRRASFITPLMASSVVNNGLSSGYSSGRLNVSSCLTAAVTSSQKAGCNQKLSPSASEPNITITASSSLVVAMLSSDDDDHNHNDNDSADDESDSDDDENNNVASPMSPRTPIDRMKFKQLNFYEKMYTLVKTLYKSLDLKITCKKIMNTVSLLLDADRCSLFLVIDEATAAVAATDGDGSESTAADDENNNPTSNQQKTERSASSSRSSGKFLVSVVFDAKSKSSHHGSIFISTDTSNSPNNTAAASLTTDEDEQIRIPYGVGIAGHVAATKQALNIQDAYADPRFNASIDQRTGYRTRSILCLPILNEKGECIAVAEAINKLSDFSGIDDASSDNERQFGFSQQHAATFTSEDEETFAKFMPFISIAIRNSNLYAQSRREAQTNKVLLELATIVFDESSTTVDNLVSRILFNSLYLLECEKCQVVLLNRSKIDTALQSTATNRRRRHSFNVFQ